MAGKGQSPAHGIADIEPVQAVKIRKLKKCHDKKDPAAACPDQTHKHRLQTVAYPPERSYNRVHYAAEEIGHRDEEKPLPGKARHLGVRRVEGQKLRGEKIDQSPKDQADQRHCAKAVQKNPVDPAVLSRADILTGEGEICLIDRVHGDVDKALDILTRGRARHCDRAEGIDRALDHDIGQAEDRALQSRRKSHPDDGAELVRIDAEPLQIEMQLSLVPHQDEKEAERRDDL